MNPQGCTEYILFVVLQEQKWLIGIILMVPIYTLTAVIA